MPELPDVETFKRYFDKHCLHHKIKSVELRTPKILEKISPHDLGKLKKEAFTASVRYGKYLFAKTTKGFYLVMHFGMTGFLFDFTKENPFNTHSRILFTFENGHTLAYVNARLLGKVTLIDSLEDYLKEKKLGPDALDITQTEFQKIFHGKASVKSALMDQENLAGVGNVYTDETLFQTGIHPEKPCEQLSKKEISSLYRNMRSVLKIGIEVNGDPEKMPKNWLLPRRRKKESCPKCGSEIHKIEVIGRPTYFCLNCQK